MLDNSTSTSGQRSCIQLLSTATECACAFRVFFFCIFIPFQEDYGDACFPVRLKLMSSNRTAGTFLDAGRKVSIPGLVLLATSRPSNYAVSDFTRGTRHPQHFWCWGLQPSLLLVVLHHQCQKSRSEAPVKTCAETTGWAASTLD